VGASRLRVKLSSENPKYIPIRNKSYLKRMHPAPLPPPHKKTENDKAQIKKWCKQTRGVQANSRNTTVGCTKPEAINSQNAFSK